MTELARSRAVLFAVVGVIVLGSGIGACTEKRTVSPASTTGELPDQEVSDFSMTETDEGRVEWKLYARDAAIFNARNLVVGNQVRVDFFDETGRKSSELTARRGDFNQRTRNMTALGNVVLQTTEGTRLSSEVLRFLNREQKIVVPTEELVRVERRGDVLTGYGFESDPELKHYEFKRRVQATVRTRSGGLVDEHNP